MPTFSITVSDAAALKIKAMVDRYNQNTGQSLTVAQWILLHLKELAIGEQLGLDAEAMKKAAEDKLTVDIEARRQSLMGGV